MYFFTLCKSFIEACDSEVALASFLLALELFERELRDDLLELLERLLLVDHELLSEGSVGLEISSDPTGR